MQGFRPELFDAVNAMAYLFKMLDPDGIDVSCTSSPDKKERCTTATKAVNFVKKSFSEGNGDDCHIERALEAILSSVRKGWAPDRISTIRAPFNIDSKTSSRDRGVSVYILTDGRWEPTSDDGVCGADKPIQVMINQMKNQGVGRTRVSLQFAKFGDHPVGAQRLEKLDDDISKTAGNED